MAWHGFAAVSAMQSYVKMTTLRTARLTLRPLTSDDAEAYIALRAHPEVARWVPPATGDPIGRFAAGWRQRGYAPWGVVLDGRLIGHGGLNWVPEFAETEVLWALHPDAWGRGYATEVAQASLDYGFGTLGLGSIFAITLPDNAASQAVMKRIGLTYRRRATYKGFDVVWFDMDRTVYAERTAMAAR
ncbi:MAG: N-acetyltransferase [Alphaproteobacteria bacterium]|nr:N-acetyltransferase [Alphaproteobacteria bacterium]